MMTSFRDARKSGAIAMPRGVSALVESYDGFVLDLWGVIHDGVEPYPGALECLDRLRAAGKATVLLSNAPRRVAAVVEAMAAMGIPRDRYDAILTSGEAAWRALRSRDDFWHAALGRRVHMIGGLADRALLDGLELEEAARPGAADFILNIGVADADETIADHERVLAEGAAAGVPMICANPDLEVIRGGKRVMCAGSIAARYEALGGQVRYHGKPHQPVYGACLALLGVADQARVVAIGDSLHTDVAGARGADIDSVLVTGGIHADELCVVHGEQATAEAVAAACRQAGERPVAAIPAFVW
jgi:HAD superfamily hydrolase (TIGR01459 family)